MAFYCTPPCRCKGSERLEDIVILLVRRLAKLVADVHIHCCEGIVLLAVQVDCHLRLDELLVALALVLAQAALSPGVRDVAEQARDAVRATDYRREEDARLAEACFVLHAADRSGLSLSIQRHHRPQLLQLCFIGRRLDVGVARAGRRPEPGLCASPRSNFPNAVGVAEPLPWRPRGVARLLASTSLISLVKALFWTRLFFCLTANPAGASEPV
mmetsp:Transcript_87932/g.283927  ORF Transcript_87932/g.283927 Transcript_87932/m.283927 type:complete len:214 (-) Transcript_87932:320-961(-)